MQLKKLEMCGFKSFANRTEIVFNKGITGIVGPNGCGKSNVVDSIKWVLGTLSYKAVRGDEMLDVIFKGAEGVPAMGFAEVSLTFDNADHTLPLDFTEVTITRRLFASGEGEYSINGAACRLRDIRDLLYGTGVGTDNYSVIEQGKIDRLVLANPHERRLVFDEAAGISKFRARKKEAEHRLERVSQDLLRILDVTREVQKQLRSIRAQAGRAARYRELQEEYRAKRRTLFVREFRARSAREAEMAARLKGMEDVRARQTAAVESHEAALEELRKRLEAEVARHAELTSLLASLESQKGYLERAAASAEERRAELKGEIDRTASERISLEVKEQEISALMDTEARALAEADALTRARAVEVQELRSHLDDAARECSRVGHELDARKAEAVEMAHKEAQYRNERERLAKDVVEFQAQAADAAARREKILADRADLGTRLAESRAARAALEAEIADLTERRKAGEAELARLREESAQLEREVAQFREGKDHRVARRETLRDLEEQREGLDAGARKLLEERLPGVLGTVADFLDVPADRVAAVEGALGDRAGAVVCESEEQALGASTWVKVNGLSRTVVISLEGCRGAACDAAELQATGAVARASDWASVEDRFRGLLDALLGRTLVVSDAATAVGLRQAGATGCAMVTPDGDLFEPEGFVTTGGARASQGLLSRKAELRRLETEIDEYLALLGQKEVRLAEVQRFIHVAGEKSDLYRQQIYEKNIAMGEAASQIEQISSREKFLAEEESTLGGELDAIARQAQAAADRSRAVESLLMELASVKDRVAAEIVTLGETQARYEKGRAELQENLTRAKVEGAKAGEQKLALDRRLEMLRADHKDVALARENTAQRLEESRGRLEAAVEELDRVAAEQEALAQRVGETRVQAEEAGRVREARAAEHEAAQAERSRLEGERQKSDEEIHRVQVEAEGERVARESLERRAREDMGIELAAKPDAPDAAPVDEAALGREVEALAAKIAGYGAVNLGALDQLSELEEREKFLLSQQEDMDKSKSQLEDLIRQLGVESRELFEKTLGIVREHFNTIFRKLFGGGKADILLEQAEGMDPMEQGLEIMARPPQKELTAISLLSGGERTLTAIALVMALFKANPSPFCLLDEADAALDERNVDRYAGLVREFSADTQFIVITHNKRTMAVGDVLYGVTMERPGISKKVSVNLSGDGTLDLLKKRPSPEPVPVPA